MLRLLRDELRVAAMMRDAVVRLRHADIRIAQAGELARHDHARDARRVGLERQHLQVVHEPRVLLVGVGNVGRPLGQSDVAVAARFGGLDAPLDLAHGIEILVELGAVAAADRRREPRGLGTDGVQDAAAERVRASRSALEPPSPNSRSNTTRGCVLGQVRRRLVAPRDGVDVETVAGIARALRGGSIASSSDATAVSLPMTSRGQLIRRRRELDLDAGARAVVGMHAREPRSRGARVIARAVAERVGLPVREARDTFSCSRSGSSGFRLVGST